MWSEHTKRLPPLVVGDSVRIQNQVGAHPNKWDKTGNVIKVRQFDQYVIRVDGSGRVTIRNRKFLRKYTPVATPAPRHLITDDLAYSPRCVTTKPLRPNKNPDNTPPPSCPITPVKPPFVAEQHTTMVPPLDPSAVLDDPHRSTTITIMASSTPASHTITTGAIITTTARGSTIAHVANIQCAIACIRPCIPHTSRQT